MCHGITRVYDQHMLTRILHHYGTLCTDLTKSIQIYHFSSIVKVSKKFSRYSYFRTSSDLFNRKRVIYSLGMERWYYSEPGHVYFNTSVHDFQHFCNMLYRRYINGKGSERATPCSVMYCNLHCKLHSKDEHLFVNFLTV